MPLYSGRPAVGALSKPLALVDVILVITREGSEAPADVASMFGWEG